MCVDPVTGAFSAPMLMAGSSFAIGGAGALSKFGAGMEDAAAQLAYQRQERYNAEVARNYEFNQLGARQLQERDQATQALVDNQIRAIKSAETAKASAAEHGVEGHSIESVARNFYREEGRIDASTERNLKMTVQQLQEEKQGAVARYKQRTNFPEVKQPSLLGLGLEIAGSAVSAYDLYDRRNNPFGRRATR